MQFYRLVNENIAATKNKCIALIGGGGKTALLNKLAKEFSNEFPSVLQTSLTKTAFYKSENPIILNNIKVNDLKSINANPVFIIGEQISDKKLLGISEADLDVIRKLFDVTIFECDGARNKPLKAHTDYDPIVPKFTTDVIIIVGADVVNTRISDGSVHRPELFCKIWDVDPDKKLSLDFIVDVISTKRGYFSKIIYNVNITYYINKADRHRQEAQDLANKIFNRTGKPTFYGSIKRDLLEKVN